MATLPRKSGPEGLTGHQCCLRISTRIRCSPPAIARGQFIVLDIAAAILWAGTWMGLGYVFSDALELVASRAGHLGNWIVIVVGAALASYVVIKVVQRRRFLRSLRTARDHARGAQGSSRHR